MANCLNRAPCLPETDRRTVLLCAFTMFALIAGRDGRSDDRIHPNLPGEAQPQLVGWEQPVRLPPIDRAAHHHLPASHLASETQVTGASYASESPERWESRGDSEPYPNDSALQPLPCWFDHVRVGYDSGFVIASEGDLDLQTSEAPFRLRINGWGQIRHSIQDSKGPNKGLNQFQLKRARLVFAGSAFTSDVSYFLQLDGRSSSGDDMRLLDYFLTWDFGRHLWGLDRGTLAFKAGKYKMPFTMSRYLSGRELEFSDRSVASMYFDVNRSLGWGLYGKASPWCIPVEWETAIFNGLVTGGAETGSSGTLDNNFAYSARILAFPTGEWGAGELADLDWHETLATRLGIGFANTTINRMGSTEFGSIRVVDSGDRLSNLLPPAVTEYGVNIYSLHSSCKYHGWSLTAEYYLRNIGEFQGETLPDLFDHGFWLQVGKFIVPGKLELLSRWSRVVGNSGTLGTDEQSAEEIAGGLVWYFRKQNAKLTLDATYLDGAPINSSALDVSAGDIGWLLRTQIQFAF